MCCRNSSSPNHIIHVCNYCIMLAFKLHETMARVVVKAEPGFHQLCHPLLVSRWQQGGRQPTDAGRLFRSGAVVSPHGCEHVLLWHGLGEWRLARASSSNVATLMQALWNHCCIRRVSSLQEQRHFVVSFLVVKLMCKALSLNVSPKA